jgi:hypothetical protein
MKTLKNWIWELERKDLKLKLTNNNLTLNGFSNPSACLKSLYV